jgi:hypothetical protein
MRTTISKFLLIVSGTAMTLSAQAFWSANATTAVPNFQGGGTVKTTTVDTTVHGRGVQARIDGGGNGVSYLYIPVTAPQGSTMGCISLRAMDNTSYGSIKAEFLRQPRDGNPGPAVTLGSVGTHDAAGDGFQFDSSAFAAQGIDYSLYTYYIRLDLAYRGSTALVVPVPIALDVSLSQYCPNTIP